MNVQICNGQGTMPLMMMTMMVDDNDDIDDEDCYYFAQGHSNLGKKTWIFLFVICELLRK